MMKGVLQTLAGVAVVVLVLVAVGTFVENRRLGKLPEGWQIISSGDTNAILILGDEIWAGGRDGLAVFDRASLAHLPLPEALESLRIVHAIIQDSSGSIWVAHDRGVSRQTSDGWQRLSADALQLSGPARSLWADPDGTVLVGGEGGAVRWLAGQITPLPIPGEGLDTVSTLFRDRSGALWLGSDTPHRGGLLRWEKDRRWTCFSAGQDLIHSSINDIMQDPAGNLWIATGFAGRGGMSVYDGVSWGRPNRGNTLSDKKARSVFLDRQGNVWLGHEYDGASVLHDGVWKHLSVADGLAGEEVKVVRQDHTGTYWIGTNNGLSVIAPGRWQEVAKAPADDK